MPVYNGVDCFTKAICVMQWMFIRASAADSRFLVAGRSQVLLKSTQCATPSLTFCMCNCIVLETGCLERIHGQAVN